MALTFIAAGATASGGLALSVSQPISNLVQVGDLIVWAVAAEENSRGWGGGFKNTGSVPAFTDLSTDPLAVVLNGRSQYIEDNGAVARRFIWLGYKIATVADTGGATYTATLLSSPVAGLGVGSAYAVYRNPGGSTPIYALAANLQNSTVSLTSWTAPSAASPAGTTGTFTYVTSLTNANFCAAQTSVVFGDAGDYYVLILVYGEGGSGLWDGPASVTDRVAFNSGGAPSYMFTWSDGPTAAGATIRRLPLLGAG